MTEETPQISTYVWEGWTMVGAIATVIAAIATVLYTYFTYHLLSATKASIDIANENRDKANKLAEFQIYTKLSDDLSSPKALELFDIIEKNCFDIEEINETQPGAYSNPPRDSISGKDLRRFILGPIEDLAKFKDDNIISIESIDSGFGNTILMLGNNEQVVKYIKYLRTKIYYADNIHCGFESLYKEELNMCTDEEKAKYKNHFD
jgi:hypothetical protein